jgi:hypothetical protein
VDGSNYYQLFQTVTSKFYFKLKYSISPFYNDAVDWRSNNFLTGNGLSAYGWKNNEISCKYKATQEHFPWTEYFPKLSLLKVEKFQLQIFYSGLAKNFLAFFYSSIIVCRCSINNDSKERYCWTCILICRFLTIWCGCCSFIVSFIRFSTLWRRYWNLGIGHFIRIGGELGWMSKLALNTKKFAIIYTECSPNNAPRMQYNCVPDFYTANYWWTSKKRYWNLEIGL